MKRGLVVLDHTEIPESEWQDRIARVRARLAADGIDVALVYGDVFRSDDIAYLTNLCLYWNESIVAIPADGEPALLTKLSPRVHTWMRRTTTLTDLRSGPSFGALVADLLADREPGTIGLVEGNLWPAAAVDEVTAAAPDWSVRPLGDTVRLLRSRPSEHEITLLRRAGVVLAEAVAAGDAIADDRERVCVAERVVRAAGFADALVRAAGDKVEITGQYRNSWLRVGRGGPVEVLGAAVAAAADGVSVAALAEAARTVAGEPCQLRVIDHVDLSTDGEYQAKPPEKVLAAGEVVVISLEAKGFSGASDTVLIGASGAESLTAQEVLA